MKSAAQKAKPKEISFPQNDPLKKVNYSFNTAAKNGGFERQAQNQFDAINVNTRLYLPRCSKVQGLTS